MQACVRPVGNTAASGAGGPQAAVIAAAGRKPAASTGKQIAAPAAGQAPKAMSMTTPEAQVAACKMPLGEVVKKYQGLAGPSKPGWPHNGSRRQESRGSEH